MNVKVKLVNKHKSATADLWHYSGNPFGYRYPPRVENNHVYTLLLTFIQRITLYMQQRWANALQQDVIVDTFQRPR